ncbi:MAG TPA: SH3 domain-containing protein [Rhodothermales bacterium]|nr:SH3 domain-containing protein [Rhodothermales bacterium]HRR07280.1 SH3 domain-containing protein [Rhodothermales bacterium]
MCFNVTLVLRLLVAVGCLETICWQIGYAQQAPSVLFEAGNRAYSTANYDTAIQEYEKAVTQGGISHALYYNLASAHYRRGHIGKSILYYEKALALSPFDARTRHSLAIAQKKIQTAISQLPLSPLQTFWHYIRFQFGSWGLFGIAICLYVMTIGLVAHRIWFKGQEAWRRRALLLSVPSTLIFLVMAYVASVQTLSDHKVVVLEKQVELRQGPSEQARKIRAITEGITLEVISETQGWQEVRLPNGDTGWVLRKGLGDV